MQAGTPPAISWLVGPGAGLQNWGGWTPPQSLPWAVLVLQHSSSPLQPPKRCCMGTSMSFWCEQGPVPIISFLLWGRYQPGAGVGWETPAT